SERFLSLGLPPAAAVVTGNIKFDLAIAPDLRARAAVLQQLFAGAGRPVLVAASTHEGEELMILAAYRELRQALGDCLLVLVPRHPERFDAVFALCREQGWAVLRRSVSADPSAAVDILLGDTMGELLLLLGTAAIAVFGGSLVAHGGHNVLEAAAWGVPVISGPHMENFGDIREQLCAAGGMRQLQDPAELAPCLLQLLRDPELCRRMGAAGMEVVARNRGASARLLGLLVQQLELAGD
ncbi:MAG: 3-deoxy-D-manno-octulosonic acid transferase, partial [Halioglobus sp.]